MKAMTARKLIRLQARLTRVSGVSGVSEEGKHVA